MIRKFLLTSSIKPAGDQIKTISSVKNKILDKKKEIVLLGATGTGKTFTMTKIIESLKN